MGKARLSLGFATAVVAMLVWAPATFAAATETVTDPGDAGAGTLRQALIDVDGGGTVVIAAGVNPVITSGELFTNKSTTIRGQGMNATTVRADQDADPNDNFRVFNFTAANITIEDLTITGGAAANGPGMSDGFRGGAALMENGDLTFTRVNLTGNRAGHGGSGIGGGGGGFGGAIATGTGDSLTIADSVLHGNSAGNGGAGLVGGSGGSGGAIASRGPLSISDSTIDGNSGGNAGFTATLPAGNPGGSGGGIYNEADDPTIVNSTITGNSTALGPISDAGGGIYFTSNPDVKNTIFANNTVPSGSSNANCAGSPPDDGGHNIAFPAGDGGCPATFGSGNPLLQPLAANGGPTPTMALEFGSPAIDGVPADDCTGPGGAPLLTDQRGFPRPIGAACDVGAFEAPLPPPPAPVTPEKKKCKKKKKKGKKRAAVAKKKKSKKCKKKKGKKKKK